MAFQVTDVGIAEFAVATHHRSGTRHGACDNKVVLADKTLLIIEHGSHVAVELHREQHDGQPDKVGNGKADELPLADVLPEQLPDDIVH